MAYLQEELRIKSSYGREILIDIQYEANETAKPVIVFSHGFKGFKDWGAFNEVGAYFAKRGFAFVKFNFSHNGTTPETPVDFSDLEAFSENNYSKELDELGQVIDRLNEFPMIAEMDTSRLYLLGHSRGGAISLLKTAEDKRVKKVVSWAAVGDFATRFPEDMDAWKEKGFYEIYNGRTKQQMPIKYQFYEDFCNNKDRLNLPERIKDIHIPTLLLHGTEDTTVPVTDARMLTDLQKGSHLIELAGANHTFGAVHPHTGQLAPHTKLALTFSLAFFQED